MACREGVAALDCESHAVGQCLQTRGCGHWRGSLLRLHALLDLCWPVAGSTETAENSSVTDGKSLNSSPVHMLALRENRWAISHMFAMLFSSSPATLMNTK